MNLSPRNWRPAHLLGAWGAYWAGLVAVKLGPGIAAIARLQSPDSKGSASLGFENSTLHAKVLQGTTEVWQATATVSEVALWVTLPPLLLWGLWMLMRPSREEVRDTAMLREPMRHAAPALGEGAARPLAGEPRSREGARGGRITPDPAGDSTPSR